MKLPLIHNSFVNYIKNLPGWRTKHKIVVIESDDWGSIRMPSRMAYKRLLDAGLNLNGGDGYRFSMYDSLESSSDLEKLFEVLRSVKDKNNSSAVLTALTNVANPDFERIRENGFQKYCYESVLETFKRYKGSDNTFKLWNEGIDNEVFNPQFHGREHLNISIWMNALKAQDSETLMAFDEGMWAFIPKYYKGTGLAYESAFQLSEYTDLGEHAEIIKSGTTLFEQLIGYRAIYFVPPNGKINNKLNCACYNNGIKFRSASSIQSESIGNFKERKVLHWLGQRDQSGMRYIVRNCIFEPSKQGKDWVDSCLNDIRIAFNYKKPAIISTHRVNYMGAHDTSNRNHGLRELKRLLMIIKKKWPEVRFMSSSQLGILIEAQ